MPDSQAPASLPTIDGRLELTIKINQLPKPINVENGWFQFSINCDGTIFTITVKPKVWKKLMDANEQYPLWVAAISGKLGEATQGGFVLDQPNIQVFERKPKETQSAE